MRLAVASVLALATTAAVAQNADDLQGTYKIVSGQRGDQPVPADHLDGIVKITGETMTLHDKDHNEVYVIRYGLLPAKEASQISMTVTKSSRPDAVNTKAHGLIKLQGKRITLIYDLKSAEYPNDFDPRNNDQHRFVLERTSAP
jgi:uncharacterized protein (TIGR03067 family)